MAHATQKLKMVVFILALTGSQALMAREVPSARRFNEIAQEINQTLNDTKEEVLRIERGRESQRQKSPAELVPVREEARKALESALQAYRKDRSPKNEAKVQNDLLVFTRVSTDILANLKNDVVATARQVEVVGEALATIIMNLSELEDVSTKLGNTDSPERRATVLKAKQHLNSLAQMTAALEAQGVDNKHLARIRRTLNLQARQYYRDRSRRVSLHKTLAEQRQHYEHIVAQLQVTRAELEVEKNLLAQIASGEVARNMIVPASIILVGNSNIDDLPENILKSQEGREDVMLAFQRQNDSLDNVEDVSAVGRDGDSDYPWLEKLHADVGAQAATE